MRPSAPVSTLRTVPAILACQAGLNPTAPALSGTDGTTLSYQQMLNQVAHIGEQLQRVPSDRDATHLPRYGIVMPNGPQMSAVLLAAACHGIAAPFNPKLTTPEYESMFSATAIDALVFCDAPNEAAIRAAEILSVPVIAVNTRQSQQDGAFVLAQAAQRQPDDCALLLMTSGSTGKPKIVPLSHRNICRSAFDVAQSLALSASDTCLVMWEQFHIGGLVDLLLAPIAAGSHLVAAGSFDADRFFDLQAQFAVTWFQGVPTTLSELSLQAKRRNLKAPLPHLRFLRSVAAALSPAQLDDLVQQFQVPVVRTLGMTEAGPLITTTGLTLHDPKPGSVGHSAGCEVAVMSPAGNCLGTGETGQIAVRGENVFKSYENDPDANSRSFVNDWFLTGDLGYLDQDGDLFIVGREKEIINRGGEKISPGEVDNAFLHHPAVREVASFSVAHATLGEDIACALVLSDPAELDPVLASLSERLARHKIPTRVKLMDRLPRNPVGKIDRQALAAMIEREAVAPSKSAAPETELEKLVADIWKRELSLVDVGIDDDFASVDGDSLSAVRILVELETIFGAPMPAEIIENFFTIREVARLLEVHGFGPDQASKPATDQTEVDVAAKVLSEQIIFSGDFETAENLIFQANGRSDLILKIDFVLMHMSPSQVLAQIKHLECAKPQFGEQQIGLVERLRMKAEFAKRMQDARKYLGAGAGVHRWQREILGPGVLLFSDPATLASGKSLVVGFTGNRMRLSMPTFRVLAELDAENTDLLLLIDHSRELFFNGMPNIGQDVSSVARYLDAFAKSRGYKKTVSVGASGGSLAAVLAGLSAKFDAILSIDPASLKKHPEWISAFEKIGKAHRPSAPPMRIVYGRRARHKDCADRLTAHFPHAECIRYPHAGKNILPQAQERGEFEELWKKWTS